MNDRPSILPGVLAELSQAAPSRLQKKLDKNPSVANDWAWESVDSQWRIATGNEDVLLKSSSISSAADVACSCLLGPRCFHVLAVLSVLDIDDGESADVDGDSDKEHVEEVRVHDGVDGPSTAELTPKQMAAAEAMFQQCSAIVAAGLRATGVVLQSRLLRVIHECRAEGLHRLAAAGLRVMQDVRLVRADDDTFDSAAAEADVQETLEVAWRLTQSQSSASTVSQSLIGVARRRFTPVSNLKLHGLCCEPVLTRSGYSGVVTYLMADNGWVCTVSDVQPGDDGRILQAWKSSVSVAGLALSHRDLSRSSLLVSRATTSTDGRLGGAESAKAVVVTGEGWDAPPVVAAFARPLKQQVESCYHQLNTPTAERPAGADFVFVRGTVVGYQGTELTLALHDGGLIRLTMVVDSDALRFRDNLTMLARAPGLALRCVGKIDFLRPGHLKLLAVAPDDVAASDDKPRIVPAEHSPFHVAVGLDELQRRQLSRAERHPVEIALPLGIATGADDKVDVLSRWLRAIVVGGRHAVPSGTVTSAVRDAQSLKQQLCPTASRLLSTLTQAAIGTKSDLMGVRFPAGAETLGQHWLAAATGYRAAKQHLQKQSWLAAVDAE